MAPDRLLPLRIRTSRGPRRGRAVDGEGGRYGPPAFAGLVPLAQTTVYDNRLVASVSGTICGVCAVAALTRDAES
jgi:hypothetical protein